MIGAVLLCVAVTELTVVLLAGRDRGVVPTARHRLTGLAAGAFAVVVAVLLAALAATPSGAVADVPMVLFTLAVALGVAAAWTAAGTRPWASPMLVAVILVIAGLEYSTFGAFPGALQPTWLVVLGAAAFLVEPANRITRDVLELAGRREHRRGHSAETHVPKHAVQKPVDEGSAAESTAAQPPAAPQGDDLPAGTVDTGARDPGGTVDTGAPASADTAAGLKGGRYIGPVERILMAGLGLSGAYQIVAALMAAKGIVRFPEISADAGKGSRAEEFLVGSLTSWGLAFLAALIVAGALPFPLELAR